MPEISPQETQSLIDINKNNLSLYSMAEEVSEMQKISEKLGVECIFFPIMKANTVLGYGVFPKNLEQQKRIVAEAPWVLSDFDDTTAMTTLDKKDCWHQLQGLGVNNEAIKAADKTSRLDFGQGEIYEPELDKRLMTAVLKGEVQPEESEMRLLVNKWLESGMTALQLWEMLPVDQRLEDIFQKTRHSVQLYPDTLEVFKGLRGDSQNLVKSNIFTLTYGDSVFQFGKSLHLLKEGLIQGLFLVKSKKGPFLEQLIQQSPDIFQQLALTYRFDETPRRGIDIQKFANPVIVLDDDAKQVVSINEAAERMSIPVLAVFRERSADHKRFHMDTPQGEMTIELNRDINLRLNTDVGEVRDKVFAMAIEKNILNNFTNWLKYVLSETQDLLDIYREKPRVAVIDFLKVQLMESGIVKKHVAAIAAYRYKSLNESTFIQAKEDLIKLCQEQLMGIIQE